MATDCECSEEYGPCEDHCEVIAQREGASARCSDELAAVFIGDVEACREDVRPWDSAMADALDVAAAYWEACPSGGWWEGEYENGYTYSESLYDGLDAAESALADLGLSVWWDDGYVISRITGGPLSDDAEECVWCGAIGTDGAPLQGDEYTCHACWHHMDWHRSCDVGDGPTVCGVCSAVLAEHTHPEYR